MNKRLYVEELRIVHYKEMALSFVAGVTGSNSKETEEVKNRLKTINTLEEAKKYKELVVDRYRDMRKKKWENYKNSEEFKNHKRLYQR